MIKLTILCLAVALASQSHLPADSIDLSKFKEVYANGSQEKVADFVYATMEGGPAKQGDQSAIPAIKLSLTKEPEHLVMLDIPTTVETKDLSVSLKVWASPDLQHGKGDGTWSNADPGIYYIQGAIVHPNVDFWFL